MGRWRVMSCLLFHLPKPLEPRLFCATQVVATPVSAIFRAETFGSEWSERLRSGKRSGPVSLPVTECGVDEAGPALVLCNAG
jgi:hypothetical protein